MFTLLKLGVVGVASVLGYKKLTSESNTESAGAGWGVGAAAAAGLVAFVVAKKVIK